MKKKKCFPKTCILMFGGVGCYRMKLLVLGVWGDLLHTLNQ